MQRDKHNKQEWQKKPVIFRSIYSSFCCPNVYAGWVGKQQVKKNRVADPKFA
jgi:hypothetical protein